METLCESWHRAKDKTDLRNRINAFELVHEHATAYFRHIDNNAHQILKESECSIINLNKTIVIFS